MGFLAAHVKRIVEILLSGYECIAGGDGDYFVATLLRIGKIYRDSSSVVKYPGTLMDRHLLHVKAHCGQVGEGNLSPAIRDSKTVRSCLV